MRLRIEGKRGERIAEKIERWRRAIEASDDKRAVFVARVGNQVAGLVAPGFIDDRRRVGALYIYLHVATHNEKAACFYERFGFRRTDRVLRDEGDEYGSTPITGIEMVLRAG